MKLFKRCIIILYLLIFISLNLLMVKNVKAEKDLAELEFSRGVKQYEAGNYPEALGHFEAAATAEPTYAEAQYYLGLVYHKMEQFRRSLSYWRKAMELDPQLALKVHFHLGESYYKRELFQEAEMEFQEAVNIKPDSETARSARGFLETIAREKVEKARLKEERKKVEEFEEKAAPAKKLEFTLGFGYYYDDNVILLPVDKIEMIVPPTNEIDFSPTFFFSASYKPVNTEKWEISGAYRFDQVLYQSLKDLDSQTHLGSLSLMYKISDTKQVLFDYAYTYYGLNNQKTLVQNSFSPAFRFAETASLVTELRYDLSIKDFFVPILAPEDNGDSTNHSFLIDQFVFFSPNIYSRFSYSYSEEGAKGDNRDYKSNLFRVNFSTPLFFISELVLGFSYDDRDYTHVDTFYNVKRSDIIRTFSIDLKKKYFKNALLVTLSYEYTRNGSNIPDFNYERDLVGIEFQYAF